MLARKTCWLDSRACGHGLTLQVPNRDTVGGEQLEAPDMHPGQQHDGIAGIDVEDEWPHEDHGYVGLTRSSNLRRLSPAWVLTYWTSVNPSARSSSSATCWGQQMPGNPNQFDLRRLGRRLRGDGPRGHAQEPHCPCQGQPSQEPPPAARSHMLGAHGHLFQIRVRVIQEHRPVDFSSITQTGAAPNA